MAKIIVLDTSFLIELFGLPVDSDQDAHERACACYEDILNKNYDIYVPLGVVYELANHIVDVKNPGVRHELATKFTTIMLSAWKEDIPFTIIPSADGTELKMSEFDLLRLCEVYSTHLNEGLSLTDCTIIEAASTLKENYKERGRKWLSHILTKHQALKSYEPDSNQEYGF
ncbi:hypothetical protein [Aeromonas veronii]|uniref:hypothetical protein n=1 Tax=Aeromonas veronii TaxID=654 RepID=UPI003A4E3DE0